MKFLRKKNNKMSYSLIKLHKIVDLNEAKEINIQNIASKCLDFIFSIESSYPEFYEINYGKKSWKSKKAFDLGLTKMKDESISDLAALFSASKSSLNIGNNILNIIPSAIPDQSMTSIDIAVPSLTINSEQINSFFIDIYKFFQFDYGYVTKLTDDYDFITERKIKKRLFSQEFSIEEIDNIWQFHSVGLKYGFIKKLYPMNFLNNSQINQPIIKGLIEKELGHIRQLNDEITMWELDTKDFNYANKELIQSKYVIYNEENPDIFLQTPEASKFNKLMMLNKETY